MEPRKIAKEAYSTLRVTNLQTASNLDRDDPSRGSLVSPFPIFPQSRGRTVQILVNNQAPEILGYKRENKKTKHEEKIQVQEHEASAKGTTNVSLQDTHKEAKELRRNLNKSKYSNKQETFT